MTMGTPSGANGPPLQCLMGARATATLGRDLASVLELSEKVRSAYWDVLQGCLGPQLDERTVNRLRRFGRDHEIDAETLLPSVKAFRFLLRSAARHNTSRAAVLHDVQALFSGEAPEGLEAIAGELYDLAFPTLRREVVMRSVAEHGTLAQQVHWRLETLQASDHGIALDVPLTSLTFVCLDGQTQRNVTVQLLPDVVEQLRDVCDTVLKS